MPLNLNQTAEQVAIKRLQRENAELQTQLSAALKSRILDEDYERFVTRALTTQVRVPDWVATPRKNKKHLVMPVTNFSDWHLDEVVRPEEIQFKNAYNRQIAERRLKFYFENVCKVAHSYVSGFEYPGIVINMLGDNFSGFIHEELRRTNADTMMSSLLHWLGPVQNGLKMLADAFGKVWVTGVVGNHGRHDKKPIAKMRAHENFDWLFMQLLKTMLENSGEKRIEFLISNGQKLRFNIFDTRIITSHGDEARGGSGIAGLLSPLLIAYSRMKKTFEFDQWFIGHWHNLSEVRAVIRVNGSGKGYDEYASISNFDFQLPLQDFFLIAPRVGITAKWPIHCLCPHEPWMPAAGNSKPFSI